MSAYGKLGLTEIEHVSGQRHASQWKEAATEDRPRAKHLVGGASYGPNESGGAASGTDGDARFACRGVTSCGAVSYVYRVA